MDCENCKNLEALIEEKNEEIGNLREQIKIATETMDNVADNIKDCLRKL